MRTLLLVVLWVLATGCNLGPSTPTFGNWKVTEITGSITHTDTGSACVGRWTFSSPDLASGWNGVKVRFNGDLEYFLSFHGVAGSPQPDGYDLAGPAKATGGEVTGNNSQTELGLVTTAHGTFDSAKMVVAWTFEQHVEAGACKTDVSGSGTFTAVPP